VKGADLIMPKNCNTVQLLTITDSRYKLGDMVKYKIDFGDTTIEYFCCVIGRTWVNDESEIPYWEYIVEYKRKIKNGKLVKFVGWDTVGENELEVWKPSEINSPLCV
jgi:hypothetical protein